MKNAQAVETTWTIWHSASLPSDAKIRGFLTLLQIYFLILIFNGIIAFMEQSQNSFYKVLITNVIVNV